MLITGISFKTQSQFLPRIELYKTPDSSIKASECLFPHWSLAHQMFPTWSVRSDTCLILFFAVNSRELVLCGLMYSTSCLSCSKHGKLTDFNLYNLMAILWFRQTQLQGHTTLSIWVYEYYKCTKYSYFRIRKGNCFLCNCSIKRNKNVLHVRLSMLHNLRVSLQTH
jgi:hypothetical protein